MSNATEYKYLKVMAELCLHVLSLNIKMADFFLFLTIFAFSLILRHIYLLYQFSSFIAILLFAPFSIYFKHPLFSDQHFFASFFS